MPVVEVDPDELRRLAGTRKDDDDLKDDLFALGLEFEGETEDGAFELEFAPDRLDRLSVEGVARSLRYQYGDARGVYVPETNAPEWTFEVDETVPDERPYVTGAVVRGVDLDEAALDALIQLQEKLHATMGRKRAKGAIGIHDLTMLKGESPVDGRGKSITYRGVAPDGDRFVPLDGDREMTPAEVLAEHHIGTQYADLVTDYGRYPAIYDDIGLFSFPPVVNGRRTEVSTDSRDLLVELTGTDQWTIDKMCTIICYALDARGGTVESVTVDYGDRDLHRPDLSVDTKRVAHARIESTLGVDLDPETVEDLFERSGLDATVVSEGEGVAYDVDVPPYRVDVLHPVDLVDDVGRAYGFDDLVPRYPDVSTVGGRHERSRHERAVRDALVGIGFEDLLNFHLISEADNFERMGLPDPTRAADERSRVPVPLEHGARDADPAALGDVLGYADPATIAEPYSEDYTMVRTWVLPSLLMVLENNPHRTYPQDLSEIGLAMHVDPGASETGVAEARHVGAVLARHEASYEDARGRLQTLARQFGADLETPPADHPAFVDGRTAAVELDGERVGVIGELHPAVLVEHDLELPVSAFEFDV
ncbi:MAG: phenylalanine--tRNA ligase subunit beta, partial [Halobacteriaceae archaeon]